MRSVTQHSICRSDEMTIVGSSSLPAILVLLDANLRSAPQDVDFETPRPPHPEEPCGAKRIEGSAAVNFSARTGIAVSPDQPFSLVSFSRLSARAASLAAFRRSCAPIGSRFGGGRAPPSSLTNGQQASSARRRASKAPIGSATTSAGPAGAYADSAAGRLAAAPERQSLTSRSPARHSAQQGEPT